jgi:glc operon protein GlcG
MSRLTMMAGALGVALLMSTGAFAQVPPDPANPNETLPDAMPFNIPYGEPISIADAKKVAAAAVAEAATRHWLMCISIVGPSGDLIYFEKMDGSQNASVSISQHKARVAAKYRRPTLVFERLVAKGAYFTYLTTLDDIVASRGGNPLIVGGKLVGAIGVSGGTGSQDDTISLAGMATLK